MSVNSISQRPVAASFATPAASSTAPAAAAPTKAPLEAAEVSKKMVALPDGFEKLSARMGPGPVVHGGPRQLEPQQDLKQSLESLTKDLGQLVETLHGDGAQAPGLDKSMGPASARDRVQDVAREALGQQLDGFKKDLSKLSPLNQPAMAIGGPAAERYFAKQGEKNKVHNALQGAVKEVEQLLSKGGTQNLAKADKALELMGQALKETNQPSKGEPTLKPRASDTLQELSDVLGKKLSTAPKGLELPRLPKDMHLPEMPKRLELPKDMHLPEMPKRLELPEPTGFKGMSRQDRDRKSLSIEDLNVPTLG